MAKAPSARVSRTSGQGVSRLGYQKGYSLGNRGTGSSGKNAVAPMPSVKSDRVESKSARSSAKGKIDQAGGMNISYGDTLFPTDLKDVQSVAKRTPTPNQGFLKQGKPLKFKAGKSDSGFLKGKK
jgi:hypothetical protein